MTAPQLATSLRRDWLTFNRSSIGVWPEACRSGGLVLALNFQGEGEIALTDDTARRIRPGSLVWLRDVPPGPQSALRLPSERHECLCLFYSDAWLAGKLDSWHKNVPSELRPLLIAPTGKPQLLTGPMEAEDRGWARGLMAPHLCDGAREILEAARMAEFFIRKLFAMGKAAASFSTRTKRATGERLQRVKIVLRDRLDDPPPLHELARLAGCNPHYLSRTFAAEEGVTISAYLRRLRVEMAAELIASGRCNVSEAATEVGYRSIGHFTRAFVAEKGVVPSLWVRTLAEEKEWLAAEA